MSVNVLLLPRENETNYIKEILYILTILSTYGPIGREYYNDTLFDLIYMIF